MAKMQLVIVTPETTTFDASVDAVTLPLIDGEAGVLPGHAPMIGRLGPGELRVTVDGQQTRFYVDGGFAQVEQNVVTVLPGRSVPVGELKMDEAEQALELALKQPADNADLAAIKERAIAQAKAQLRMAARTNS